MIHKIVITERLAWEAADGFEYTKETKQHLKVPMNTFVSVLSTCVCNWLVMSTK